MLLKEGLFILNRQGAKAAKKSTSLIRDRKSWRSWRLGDRSDFP
jgi:hypothetical protein